MPILEILEPLVQVAVAVGIFCTGLELAGRRASRRTAAQKQARRAGK